MALNPYFLQGSPGEQSLVQDLINEQLKIYGIEVVMSAVIDAIENSKRNDVGNINFFHGDLIDFFRSNCFNLRKY